MKTASCSFTGSAADYLPHRITLPLLKVAGQKCRGCELYCNATQAVFGEGPTDAAVMFIGEQPGDQEDLAGRPFVGPAGKLLDESLKQAGIDRETVYVTNAVKHFKFQPRGKRRLHSKPNSREVKACLSWLEAEIELIQPQVIVALGATAAQALMGTSFRLTQHRGEVFSDTAWGPNLIATVHPFSLLRIPDPQERHRAKADFIRGLKLVARHLGP